MVPKGLIESVAAEAPAQEALEQWIMDEVMAGSALPGLYPPNAENKARFEAHQAEINRIAGK